MGGGSHVTPAAPKQKSRTAAMGRKSVLSPGMTALMTLSGNGIL
jgi:hypothetical protein